MQDPTMEASESKRKELGEMSDAELLTYALARKGEEPRGVRVVVAVSQELRTLAELAEVTQAGEYVDVRELGDTLDMLARRLEVGIELVIRDAKEASDATRV